MTQLALHAPWYDYSIRTKRGLYSAYPLLAGNAIQAKQGVAGMQASRTRLTATARERATMEATASRAAVIMSVQGITCVCLQIPRGSPVVSISLNVFGHKEVGLRRSHQVSPAQAATLSPVHSPWWLLSLPAAAVPPSRCLPPACRIIQSTPNSQPECQPSRLLHVAVVS